MPKAELPASLDVTSRHGAGVLCDMIERYWHGLGHKSVVAERYEVFPGAFVNAWGVRTNLVAGLPPRKARK